MCQQIEVHVFLLEKKISQKLNGKVKLHIVNYKQSLSGSFFYKHKTARLLRKKVHQQEPFCCIISTLPFCDSIVKATGITGVHFRIANTLSHEVRTLSYFKSKRRFKGYVTLYRNENLIAVSNGVKKDMIETFDYPEKKITTIYNPIDIKKLVQLSKEKITYSGEDFIVYAGRFSKQKRIDLLLDAWKVFLGKNEQDVPQKLVMLTPWSEALNQMILVRNLEDKVKALGYQKKPYPWLKSAKSLIFSSDREGMPNVLLKALALGAPVASTDCPSGPREILGDSYPQSLAVTNDPVALAAAIKNSLKTDFDKSEEILETFEPSKILQQILVLGR